MHYIETENQLNDFDDSHSIHVAQRTSLISLLNFAALILVSIIMYELLS